MNAPRLSSSIRIPHNPRTHSSQCGRKTGRHTDLQVKDSENTDHMGRLNRRTDHPVRRDHPDHTGHLGRPDRPGHSDDLGRPDPYRPQNPVSR